MCERAGENHCAEVGVRIAPALYEVSLEPRGNQAATLGREVDPAAGVVSWKIQIKGKIKNTKR
jgi:hypothetical protein